MDNILKVKWSKRDNDFVIYYPIKCDGSLLQQKLFSQQMLFDFEKFSDPNSQSMPYKMEVDFIEELEKRGYDKTTLTFSIKLKSS